MKSSPKETTARDGQSPNLKSANLKSLRARLTLSFLGVIVATAGLVVVMATLITANRFTYMISSAGQRYAWRLAPLFSEYYVQTGGWGGIEALVASWKPAGQMPGRPAPMAEMMLHSRDERLLLLDATGRLIADSDPQGEPVRLLPASLDKGAPILVDGQQVGTLIVASGLGRLTSYEDAFLRQANRLMLVAGVVAVLAVLVVSGFQARRIVAPVRALAEAARQVASGDLSQRVSVTSQDELGEMAVAFNTMAAELARQHELRRRAMTDIAHELRTPLSVLQIELESIEDGLTTPTPEVIAGLQTDVAHLRRLVDDLRMLSLAEAGELQMEVEPVEMGDLIQDVLNRVQGAARAKGITLDTRVPATALPVTGDPQRLAQVLLNLLSNAMQHTPSDGQITVSAQRVEESGEHGEEVHVTVQDTGEGIPAEDLPHIFERFYRTDRARSRETGGSGLGLSITRSLVEAHGGRLWAHSTEDQGSAFTFALPLTYDIE
ncbi:MAG: HAMP domain-containing protein [Chloroflexi bacterium]|nr:HAMP domain-containing protein [Chloroflexota bacterium]